MKSRFTFAGVLQAGLLCVIAIASISTSKADLKVVTESTIDMSKMSINGQPLTDQQKSMFQHMPMFQSGGMASTVYTKGLKSRVEMSFMTMISDYGAKTLTSLDNTNKTYWTKPLDLSGTSTVMKNMQFDIKDLGTTQQILGYTCHGYDITVTSKQMNMDMQMWTAQGLFQLPVGFKFGNPWVDQFKDKITGYPLKMVMTMSSPMLGQAVTTTQATSVSTDSLPDSLFSPPADYKQVDSPTMPSGMGMPMPRQ